MRSRLVLPLAVAGAGVGALAQPWAPWAALITIPLGALVGRVLDARLRSPSLLLECIALPAIAFDIAAFVAMWVGALPSEDTLATLVVGSITGAAVFGVPAASAAYRAQSAERARAGSLVRASDGRAILANVAVVIALLAWARGPLGPHAPPSRLPPTVAAAAALGALALFVLDVIALGQAREASAALGALAPRPGDGGAPPTSRDALRVDWGLGDGVEVAERAPDDPYRGSVTVDKLARGSQALALRALRLNVAVGAAKLLAASIVAFACR
jgi:hypothetical protein